MNSRTSCMQHNVGKKELHLVIQFCSQKDCITSPTSHMQHNAENIFVVMYRPLLCFYKSLEYLIIQLYLNLLTVLFS